MAFDLSQIGFAKTDDPDTPRDRGETQHMQALRQIAHRHIAQLWVGFAGVWQDEG
jgi:hypothetical protein